MKNKHILPTDKPSRLGRFIDTGKLSLRTDDDIPRGENINIYITSDEKIKKRDWYFNPKTNKVNKVGHYGHYGYSSKKIILTTDPDLIKDGVQGIDDEFLEWFVKNPSCERVEVDIEKYVNLTSNPISIYKIIIPQEEPVNPNNQEVMFHEEHKEYFYEDFIDGKFVTVWLGKDYIPQEKPKQIKCYCGHTITCDCEPLQETIEEAAEMYIQSKNPQWTPYHKQSFKDGAKWQQERMEEDMINFAHFYFKEEFNSTMQTNKSTKELLSEWFEQNKKKFG